MQKLNIDDLMDYKFLSGIVISPAGTEAAFLVKQANRKKNSYDSWVYMMDLQTKEVRKLTSFGAEANLIFDGERTVLFSSERFPEDQAEKGKEKTVFYRLSTSGGEAERAFELPFQVDSIKKISADCYAFTAVVDLNQPEDEEELAEYQDYHILEELPYWENGAYFVSRHRRSLFVFKEHEETEKRIQKVTSDLFGVDGFQINGQKLIYTGASYDSLMPKTRGLFSWDIQTGKEQVLVDQDQMTIGLFASVNEEIWFAGSKMEQYGSNQYPDIYRWEHGKVTKYAEFGHGIGSVPTGDIMLGGGEKLIGKDKGIQFVSCVGTTGEIYECTDGQVKKAFAFDGSVDCFAAVKGGLLIAGRTPGKLQELYYYEEKTGTYSQVTELNGQILKDKYVGEPVYEGFTDSDGIKIDGWVILPKDYDPAKTYPAILDMHGGPRVAFGNTFFHEMQWLANEGYFVLFCNPRGSDGRGNEFADLREKYGTIDFTDFMEFTDHILERYPAIDPQRVGVTGGSYGGWMTNWIIGHTDRFAAAVSQRSFSNWLSDFGCSEIGFSFDVEENGGKTPWTAPKELWERSPVAYADRVKTPTLFLHSLKDYNCPLSEGMQMFAALKYHGVPSKAFLFEGENHELSRSGKPLHRIRRLKEMKDWFDRYLNGSND